LKILIFDYNSSYANMLAALLAEVIGREYEIHLCKDFCDLEIIMEEKNIDILLIEEEAWLKYSEKETNVTVILLCNDLITLNKAELDCIYKFQSVYNISKQLKEIYSRLKPEMISLSNKNQAKLLLVYSPLGGSGKTTISLALSNIFNNIGLEVFYLNLETFSSDKRQTKKRGDLSKLLKLSHDNKPLRLELQRLVKTDHLFKYKYISSIESHFDLIDVDKNDLKYLVEQIKNNNFAEVIIIDSDAVYGEEIKELFELVDEIYLINIDSELANTKFQSFKKLTSFYNKYLNKTKFILNKTNQVGKSEYILIPDYKDISDSQVISKISKEIDFRTNVK